MRVVKAGLFVIGFLCASLPSGQDVQAYYTQSLDQYFSYPLPADKPNICERKNHNENEDDFNQKQAAAAALGLYLGVKLATAPHGYKEETLTTCAR